MTTRRCTVYLLQDVEASHAGLRRALHLRYERDHGFELRSLTVGSATALLCTGVIGRGRPPDWAAAVDRLTGVVPAVENKTAAGALLVAVDGQVFALTFGMGHLLLDQAHVAPGFGFGFALRALEPTAVRQVTHSAMDARGRTDRNSVGQDEHIRGFGIEEYGEVVSRLVGKLGKTGLSCGQGPKRSVQISGTDALKVHLGVQPSDLLADLAEITRTMAEASPAPEFDAIARVRELRARDERLPELRRLLAELVADPSCGSIAVSVPSALLDEEDRATSYRIKIGRRYELFDDLDLDDVSAKVGALPPAERIEALRSGYIQMCADAEPASPRVSALKWLAAEVSLGSSRFCLHEGRWYEVGDRHLETIRDQVRELLDAPCDLTLIDWTSDLVDEKAYNQAAARRGGFVCLDRAMVVSDQHPHGFEACDLLGSEGELVHVKRAASTAPLNHLFAQGRMSADALRLDASARGRLREIVDERAPGHSIPVDRRPRRVVYGISLRSGKPLIVDNLFTFAQVSLLQTATALRDTGIDVAVVDIPTVGERGHAAA